MEYNTTVYHFSTNPLPILEAQKLYHFNKVDRYIEVKKILQLLRKELKKTTLIELTPNISIEIWKRDIRWGHLLMKASKMRLNYQKWLCLSKTVFFKKTKYDKISHKKTRGKMVRIKHSKEN